MVKYIDKVLIDKDRIHQRVVELGKQITKDYGGNELFVVCVLRGAFIFAADLIRQIDLKVHVDFMSVSSYGEDTSSSGVVRILRDLDTDITGRHVLIIEDIVDTGLTLQNLRELLLTRKPASLRICAAFDKPGRRMVQVQTEYIGFRIPDEFVVGYGLDYAGQYRHLPEVCILGDDGRGDA